MSEKNETKFYHIFRFGNTIGVTEMNFSDIIIANFMTLVVMLILIGLLVTMIPFFILLLYTLSVMLGSWENIDQERIAMNVFSIIACIYFFFDYHFGFIGWRVLHTFTSTESVNKFSYLIMAMLLFNLLLLFFGNKIYREVHHPFGRLLVFIALCFFGFKILYPLGSIVVPVITTQYVEEKKINPDDENYVEQSESEVTETESEEDW